MANERNSPDPYQRDIADNDVQQANRFDRELQPEPALARGPGRIALYAVAIVVVLGALFYGLDNSKGPTETNATAPQSTSPTTARNNAAKPPVAPGVRDVTPSNAQPGVTTGAAPTNSTQPAHPQSDNTPASGARE